MRDDHDKVGFQDLMSPTTVRSRLTGKTVEGLWHRFRV